MTMYEKLKFENKFHNANTKVRIIEIKGSVTSNYDDLTLKIFLDIDNSYRILTFARFIELLNSGMMFVTNISALHIWCDRYDSLKKKNKKKTSVSTKTGNTKKTDVSSYTDFLNKVKLIKFNTIFKPEKVKVNLEDWNKLTKLDRCEKCYLRGMHGSALYYLGMADYCCTCYYIKDTDFSEIKSCLKTNFSKGLLIFKEEDDLYIQINAIKVGNDAILCCVYNDDYQTYEFTDHFENSVSGIEYEFSGKDKAFIPSDFLDSWDDAYYSNWIDNELSQYKPLFVKYLNEMGYKEYDHFIGDLTVTITSDEMGYKPHNATKLYFKVAKILHTTLHNMDDFYNIIPACKLLVDDYFTVGDC